MKKSKKILSTLVLSTILLGTNFVTAQAGVEREFWGMSIFKYGSENKLQSRKKETNEQYSWVKVTSISGNNIDRVKCQIGAPSASGGNYNVTYYYSVAAGDKFNTWIKMNNLNWTQKGYSVFLKASNYNYSRTYTGSIAGIVDYE